jgi:predicted MFS family arabinose efflux permease
MDWLHTFVAHLKGFSRNAKLILISILCIYMAASISAVVLPLYLVRMGYREDFIGYFAAAGSIAAAVAALPGGILTDRVDRRKLIIVCSLAWASGYTLLIMFPESSLLVLGNLVIGTFTTMVNIVQAPLLMDVSRPEQRSYLFSASFGAMTLINVLGSLLAGRLPSLISVLQGSATETVASFRVVLGFSVLFQAASALPLFMMDDKTEVADEERVSRALQLGNLLRLPHLSTIAKLTLANVLMAAGAGFCQPFINVMLKVRLGASTSLIGSFTAAANAFMAMSAMLVPVLERRFGMTGMAGISLASSGPLLLAMGVFTSVPMFLGVFLLRAVLNDLGHPARQRFTLETVSRGEQATVSGVKLLTWQIVWAASAAIGGSLISTKGYALAFAIGGAFYVLSGLTYAVGFRAENRVLAARGLIKNT